MARTINVLGPPSNGSMNLKLVNKTTDAIAETIALTEKANASGVYSGVDADTAGEGVYYGVGEIAGRDLAIFDSVTLTADTDETINVRTSVNAPDVQVVTDQFVTAQTELSGVPPTTEQPLAMIQWIYLSLIRPLEVTPNKKTFKNSSGTDQWAKNLTGDDTVYNEGQGGSP